MQEGVFSLWRRRRRGIRSRSGELPATSGVRAPFPPRFACVSPGPRVNAEGDPCRGLLSSGGGAAERLRERWSRVAVSSSPSPPLRSAFCVRFPGTPRMSGGGCRQVYSHSRGGAAAALRSRSGELPATSGFWAFLPSRFAYGSPSLRVSAGGSSGCWSAHAWSTSRVGIPGRTMWPCSARLVCGASNGCIGIMHVTRLVVSARARLHAWVRALADR